MLNDFGAFDQEQRRWLGFNMVYLTVIILS